MNNDRQYSVVLILFALMFLIAVGSNFTGALVNEKVAIRALDSQGYSNIKITDHSWFAVSLRGCDKGDAARFTAKATNPTGKETEVYVCTGWLFKGATVRTPN